MESVLRKEELCPARWRPLSSCFSCRELILGVVLVFPKLAFEALHSDPLCFYSVTPLLKPARKRYSQVLPETRSAKIESVPPMLCPVFVCVWSFAV